MTDFYLLKPSLSLVTRDSTYITTNGLDLGKNPQYGFSGKVEKNQAEKVSLTWVGITYAQKQTIETDFGLEKHLGSAYFYDSDGDMIFINENIKKFFIDAIEYRQTEAETYNITMRLIYDRL